MIVVRREPGWRIVRQSAHALLSAELVHPWREADRPWPAAAWVELLMAVGQHDNGWQEWQSGTWLHPSGEPRNFTAMEIEDVVAQAHRSVERAARQSRRSGALVARHILELHHGAMADPATDPRLRAVLEECESHVDAAVATPDERRELERAYDLLRYADTLSLFLCLDRLDDTPRRIAARDAAPDAGHRVRRTGESTIVVDPWPYDPPQVSVGVEAQRVERTTFPSEEALAEALHSAPVVPLRWELVPEATRG